jgi:tetratricopeptide (TPR) repeat protein
MPNGWAGYSLTQAAGFARPPLNSPPQNNPQVPARRYRYSPGFVVLPPCLPYGYPYGSFPYGWHAGYPGYWGWPTPIVNVQQGINLVVAPQFSRTLVVDRAANAAPFLQPMAQPQPEQQQPPRQRRGIETDIQRRVGELRGSTASGRERAEKTFAQADKFFEDGEYGRATARYRQALSQAPDYSKALIRLGHGYIATRNYELALDYFLLALELEQSATTPGSPLRDMYGNNRIAKQAHLEELSAAALQQPDDGGLLMLIGIFLFNDGQQARAVEFFHQADEIAGPHQDYIHLFLAAQQFAG